MSLIGLAYAIGMLGSSAYKWFVEGDEPVWYHRLQNRKRQRLANKQERKLRVVNAGHHQVDDDLFRQAETEVEDFLATKGCGDR